MTEPGTLNRRQFLRRVAKRFVLPGVLFGSGAGSYGLCYGLYEAQRYGVQRVDIALRNLPAAFDGTTIAYLADTHHGPLNSLKYLEAVVATTNDLRPDIIALGGDYVEKRPTYSPFPNHRHFIEPGVAVLAKLRGPMGRFAVLGNHDHLVDAKLTHRALARHGFTDLTNTGVWLEREGARLRLCGVDDFRCGHPLLPPALGDMTAGDAAVLLSHNPDFVEGIRDPRVDFVLSGHTHGGQVVLPFVGALVTSSWYKQKYLQGLRQGPSARVFVTRGLGTTGLPVRVSCPPEIVLVTLRRPALA